MPTKHTARKATPSKATKRSASGAPKATKKAHGTKAKAKAKTPASQSATRKATAKTKPPASSRTTSARAGKASTAAKSARDSKAKTAEVKTKVTGGTVEDWLGRIEDDARRAEVADVHALIRRVAPTLEPTVWGQFLGYGSFHYRYATGREGDWFVIGLASLKTGISLYACAILPDGGYVAERHKDALKPASVGRSCIRFKSLAQMDMAALERVLREASTAQHAM